jgi:hypothetical protein
MPHLRLWQIDHTHEWLAMIVIHDFSNRFFR